MNELKDLYVRDVCEALEAFAPLHLQESYDNCGLNVGRRDTPLTGVLLTIDVTEDVITEALDKGCNMIVAHHPLIFRGLKRLNGANYVERCVQMAIKHDIAIYAAHTNMDNAVGGVSFRMAEKLGLLQQRVLVPNVGNWCKFTTYVPTSHVDEVREALFACGAGAFGGYDSCSFNVQGCGTFRALKGANPYVGRCGELHREQEVMVSVVIPYASVRSAVDALMRVHPYEQPAYDVVRLDNDVQSTGCGVVGKLPTAMSKEEFLHLLKEVFACDVVRYSGSCDKGIQTIALCGGSGAEFIGAAMQCADAYVTADVKYHEFFLHENRILLVDIGHFESEQYTKEIFFEQLIKKIPTFAIHFSQTATRQINYL